MGELCLGDFAKTGPTHLALDVPRRRTAIGVAGELFVAAVFETAKSWRMAITRSRHVDVRVGCDCGRQCPLFLGCGLFRVCRTLASTLPRCIVAAAGMVFWCRDCRRIESIFYWTQ